MEKYYTILGVSKLASVAEIKQARNRLALKFHPDKNIGNLKHATAQMQIINEAYEKVLHQQLHQKANLANFDSCLLNAYAWFVSLLQKLQNTVIQLPEGRCKTDVNQLLNQMNCLANGPNNVLLFKHFRTNHGIQSFYYLYVKHDKFRKHKTLQRVWWQFLQHSNWF